MYARRRVAAHKVEDSKGQSFCPGVVEIDSEGVVVDAYTLETELAHTEWIGGIINIAHDTDGRLKAYKDDKEI